MDYNFNLEHPFFFTNNDYSTDTSIKYQVSLPWLESALKQYNGPYILSDKRWDEAPIYLRYGVFRPSRDDEKKVAIDELIVGDEVVKDERLPVFKIPKGIVPPDFLNK
ncbi:TPA: hypothetical protein ACL22M_001997 [Streptococcus pneumoniae]